MRTLTTLSLLLITLGGCTKGLLVGNDACTTVADCPVNTGAACAQTCSDGSNPCVNTCLNRQCVARGCPSADLATMCNVPADCPINTGASCAQTCSDGSNPCVNTCLNHQCVARGCPNSDGGTTTACAAAGGQCIALTGTPGCPNGHIDNTHDCGGGIGASCCIPSSDGGSCQPNGNACSTARECCSNNCITRVSPGYCCEPGGCP